MEYADQLKLEEYRILIEEHRKNRSYIFGNPIVVLGVVAAGMEYSSKAGIDSKEGIFILSVLIFVICFSLWFLGNRLRSDARIVSYIELVHEGHLKSKWLGWETILREYRIWKHNHNEGGDLKTLQNEEIDKRAIPSAVMFYPAIWILYFILALSVAGLIIVKSALLSKGVIIELYLLVGVASAGVAVLLFFYYAFTSLYPTRMNAVYETERATWICIFKELDDQKGK